MTPEQFCYWLQGYVELTDWTAPSQLQWSVICNRLRQSVVEEEPKKIRLSQAHRGFDNETTCDHCWHDTGMVLASLPPQYQKKCCRCGEVESYRGQLLMEDDKVHGPFKTGFVL